ncbi:MAG: hypothetical protein OXB84_07575, partial [Halobacteriovoraceae bacterium]|nr:hypothetical protein [Halobacteriovoraceae bacterium]
ELMFRFINILKALTPEEQIKIIHYLPFIGIHQGPVQFHFIPQMGVLYALSMWRYHFHPHIQYHIYLRIKKLGERLLVNDLSSIYSSLLLIHYHPMFDIFINAVPDGIERLLDATDIENKPLTNFNLYAYLLSTQNPNIDEDIQLERALQILKDEKYNTSEDPEIIEDLVPVLNKALDIIMSKKISKEIAQDFLINNPFSQIPLTVDFHFLDDRFLPEYIHILLNRILFNFNELKSEPLLFKFKNPITSFFYVVRSAKDDRDDPSEENEEITKDENTYFYIMEDALHTNQSVFRSIITTVVADYILLVSKDLGSLPNRENVLEYFLKNLFDQYDSLVELGMEDLIKESLIPLKEQVLKNAKSYPQDLKQNIGRIYNLAREY